jgi:hypothetical protein
MSGPGAFLRPDQLSERVVSTIFMITKKPPDGGLFIYELNIF